MRRSHSMTVSMTSPPFGERANRTYQLEHSFHRLRDYISFYFISSHLILLETMKAATLIFVSLIWTASSQAITYCGSSPCLEPYDSISCVDFIRTYRFFGSCCSLVDIPATGGCRVEVGGPGQGNCAWVPFCEPCSPNDPVQCGMEFQTTTSQSCPQLTYDALAIQKAWENPPTMSPAGNASGTMMPTTQLQVPPTGSCAPSTAPSAAAAPSSTSSAMSSAQVAVSLGVAATGAAYATLF